MNYTKLLEDYLNRGEGDAKVLTYYSTTEATVVIRYEYKGKTEKLDIPLFDLLTFVYSKISV